MSMGFPVIMLDSHSVQNNFPRIVRIRMAIPQFGLQWWSRAGRNLQVNYIKMMTLSYIYIAILVFIQTALKDIRSVIVEVKSRYIQAELPLPA